MFPISLIQQIKSNDPRIATCKLVPCNIYLCCVCMYYLCTLYLNPIRSGLFQTVNDPGGALKAPPPYDLENYCVNLHHIIHVYFTRCFWHDPIGIFQKFAILTILQRFQNKK